MIKNTSTECSKEYVAAIKERNRLFKKTGNMSRQKVRMLAKKSARELKNKQQSAITPFQEWATAARKVWGMTATECSKEYVEATDRFEIMRLAQENRRSMFRYRILKAKDKDFDSGRLLEHWYMHVNRRRLKTVKKILLT